MKIVVIADTHGRHQRIAIPPADVLVVAGDVCPYGDLDDIKDFGMWLSDQPCSHKIVIAGNHDAPFQDKEEKARQALAAGAPGVIYLQDSSAKIDSIIFYGSPWTPTFMNWHFMADRGAQIREKWAVIPEDTDVLITHGPPACILDTVNQLPPGCADLLARVESVMPRYNVSGHPS